MIHSLQILMSRLTLGSVFYSPAGQRTSANCLTTHHLAIALLTILSLGCAASWARDRDDHRFEVEREKTCSAVAKAAYKACKYDIQDDFWLNYGNCVNTGDAAVAEACIKQAKTQQREDRALCLDQKGARLDICRTLGETAYNPTVNPDEFLNPEAIAANPNPYFPLLPGLVRVFKAGDETITVTVTEETTKILDVICIVVRDTVEQDGELVEDTLDWYAQDFYGNVWYFGEISQNYEDGELNNLDGSWKAGIDGALPGIIMKAVPQVGDIYRQEFLLGEAEDMAEVISTSEVDEAVPAADCSDTCLVTREFLAIEPDVEELKFYAPGIGNILVVDPETGEREELIEVTMP